MLLINAARPVLCVQYYSLDISFFKSSLDSHMLDLLWNKYWVNTLSSSPLLANREFAAGQIADIADKLEQVGCATAVLCSFRITQLPMTFDASLHDMFGGQHILEQPAQLHQQTLQAGDLPLILDSTALMQQLNGGVI